MSLTTFHSDAKMTDAEYFAADGLSDSGMRDLLVSPLRYWYLHVNPSRPVIDPTPQMVFGSALHCAVLEGDAVLEQRYFQELDPKEYPLGTISDIRKFCADRGAPAKGTLKEDVIKCALAIDLDAPIYDVAKARHDIRNAGKKRLTREQWSMVTGAAESLRGEPEVCGLLSTGKPEVPYFHTDPKSGVLLKGKLDWVAPTYTLDIKTFNQQRGKPIDTCITDAIFYEAYYRKAFVYDLLRSRCDDGWSGKQHDFVLVFVEQEPPHEVRITKLRKATGGVTHEYWKRGKDEVNYCIAVYREYMAHFGKTPWRYSREVDELTDSQMPGLAYAPSTFAPESYV